MSRLMLNLRNPKKISLYPCRTMDGPFETTLPVITSVFATKDGQQGPEMDVPFSGGPDFEDY